MVNMGEDSENTDQEDLFSENDLFSNEGGAFSDQFSENRENEEFSDVLSEPTEETREDNWKDILGEYKEKISEYKQNLHFSRPNFNIPSLSDRSRNESQSNSNTSQSMDDVYSDESNFNISRRKLFYGASITGIGLLVGTEIRTERGRETISPYIDGDSNGSQSSSDDSDSNVKDTNYEEGTSSEPVSNSYEWQDVEEELRDELGYNPMDEVDEELYVKCTEREEDALMQFYDSSEMDEESYLGSERGFEECPTGDNQ